MKSVSSLAKNLYSRFPVGDEIGSVQAVDSSMHAIAIKLTRSGG
jgi:hypothetical protein